MKKAWDKMKLSISLLVSNSRNTIRKCMESLQPILKNISSELIVVDTKGTDGSIEVAKEYANIIVPFEWCNDFAKARNVGLERASGEWFLFLDDDEWFENVDEIIEFFKSGEYLLYNSASYKVRNYENFEGSKWLESSNLRMVRRTKQTKFISPIHEILDPVLLPQKEFSCYVHHYGYVYENEEEKKKHSQRNLSMLQNVLKEKKDDYRLLMHLAQEYRSIYELEKSIETSKYIVEEINKKRKKIDTEIAIAGWNIRNSICMKILLNYKEEAYHLAKKYIQYQWINTVTKNNIYFILVELSLELKKEEECFNYIERYEDTYKIISDNIVLQRVEAILEQNISFNEESRFNIVLSGFKAATSIEDKRYQRNYIQKLGEYNFFPMSKSDIKELIIYLSEDENIDLAQKIYSSFMNSEEFKKLLFAMSQEESINILDIIIYISDTYQKDITEVNSLKLEALKNIILNKELKNQSLEVLDYYLIQFINTNMEEYFKIYKEEILYNEHEFFLPETCRFSNRIKEIYVNGVNQVNKVNIIKRAVTVWSESSYFCKMYMEKMQEEYKAAEDEFFQLAESIKKAIKNYIDMENNEIALQMAKQLHQLNPSDKEVENLITILEN